jgi:hypothetical protein
MIDLKNRTMNLDLFFRFLKQIKNTEMAKDIMDSLSVNQFASKSRLLSLLDQHNIINEDSVVTVFGCWYGSILVPVLAPKVKHMILMDVDHTPVRFGKHRFFYDVENLSWIYGDVFGDFREEMADTTVFVNTSCEHMRPMNEWPHWEKIPTEFYFAFQSNNMSHIAGHINSVQSLQEFQDQIPPNFHILQEDIHEDERGKRFTLVGKKT